MHIKYSIHMQQELPPPAGDGRRGSSSWRFPNCLYGHDVGETEMM